MAIRHQNGQWTVNRLPSGDWHPEEIKAAVRMRDSSFEKLSRENNLPDHACRVAARRPHFKGEGVIANFLKVPPRQIWPSRYGKDGSRLPRHRNRREPIGSKSAGHRQIERAA